MMTCLGFVYGVRIYITNIWNIYLLYHERKHTHKHTQDTHKNLPSNVKGLGIYVLARWAF